MMINEVELNIKLAKWVGFKLKAHPMPKIRPKEKAWFYPDNITFDGASHFEINFPRNLDDCFYWLMPKLFKLGYEYKLFSDDSYHFCIIYKNDFDVAASIVGVENPALAICLAIEMLIDKENK